MRALLPFHAIVCVSMQERTMERGVVKWFNAEKGYGFIERAGRPDLFVHHTNIEMDGYRHLRPGTQVTYEIGPGREGREEAKSVRVELVAAGS